MKILKNIILLLNPPVKSTIKKRFIIKFINYGAILAFVLSLLLGIFFYIIDTEKKIYIYSFLSGSIYLILLLINNKLKKYELSKFITLILLTGDFISLNVLIIESPFYLILPFIVSIIFYGELWKRLLSLIIFYVISSSFRYNYSTVTLTALLIDFLFFVLLLTLMTFLEGGLDLKEKQLYDSISKLQQEQKRRYEETQTFFDALPIAFMYIDKNHKILRINKTIEAFFGKNIEGKYWPDLFPELERYKEIHSKVIETGLPQFNKVEEFKIRERSYWQKISRIPIKGEANNEDGIMIFATNITAIKLAENKLVLKNAELQQYIETNLQLESFAYIASHDLKEPLRMIYSFTQLLHKKLKPHFDEDAVEYMNFVLDGTERMKVLLEDLLEYSTIGRKETDLKVIDLNDIIYGVLQNLQVVIKEKKAQINIDQLPTLKVFPIQMIQLFQNLISNALKFIDVNRNPIITISVKDRKEDYLFSVQDNGIGIEQNYLDKIFLVFKRLHAREEYKGTGIGLATCKKIVENHQGRIWVESEVKKGTIFYFNIPKM